jgi:2-oxoglutarate ferredoxin oxidoreductase subunit gamma
MSESAIDTFEERLKPGGVLLVNSSLVSPDRKYRDDIKVIKVPATDIANELNNHRGTNIIMLGALAGASDLYDTAHVKAGMEHYFEKKGKNNPKNALCFDKGAEAATAQR